MIFLLEIYSQDSSERQRAAWLHLFSDEKMVTFPTVEPSDIHPRDVAVESSFEARFPTSSMIYGWFVFVFWLCTRLLRMGSESAFLGRIDANGIFRLQESRKYNPMFVRGI